VRRPASHEVARPLLLDGPGNSWHDGDRGGAEGIAVEINDVLRQPEPFTTTGKNVLFVHADEVFARKMRCHAAGRLPAYRQTVS
jgi:hypothetical protein